MKQKSNSRKSFFYHWKLSQKLFLLFLAVGILPVTVIFGFTLYRIVQKNSEMMRYVMDKNFDRVEQMMDNIQERIIRIGSLITVSDEAGTALRMVEEESLIQELKSLMNCQSIPISWNSVRMTFRFCIIFRRSS